MKTYLPTILGAGRYISEKIQPNVKITNQRAVTCYELELFFEDGGVSVINGKSYPIKRGNILFSKPGDVRFSHLPFKTDFVHFDYIPPELLERFNSFPPVFELENFSEISNEFQKTIKHYRSVYKADNISASARLLLILREIIETEVRENSIAVRAKSIIHTDFALDLKIEDIARRCHISTSHLHKVYSKTFGIGPAEALLNRRIYKAKELLSNTTLPFYEIASMCGFNSQSYFSDCFKRRSGFTPREYRENHFSVLP